MFFVYCSQALQNSYSPTSRMVKLFCFFLVLFWEAGERKKTYNFLVKIYAYVRYIYIYMQIWTPPTPFLPILISDRKYIEKLRACLFKTNRHLGSTAVYVHGSINIVIAKIYHIKTRILLIGMQLYSILTSKYSFIKPYNLTNNLPAAKCISAIHSPVT